LNEPFEVEDAITFPGWQAPLVFPEDNVTSSGCTGSSINEQCEGEVVDLNKCIERDRVDQAHMHSVEGELFLSKVTLFALRHYAKVSRRHLGILKETVQFVLGCEITRDRILQIVTSPTEKHSFDVYDHTAILSCLLAAFHQATDPKEIVSLVPSIRVATRNATSRSGHRLPESGTWVYSHVHGILKEKVHDPCLLSEFEDDYENHSDESSSSGIQEIDLCEEPQYAPKDRGKRARLLRDICILPNPYNKRPPRLSLLDRIFPPTREITLSGGDTLLHSDGMQAPEIAILIQSE
jgi:hypothetical protein